MRMDALVPVVAGLRARMRHKLPHLALDRSPKADLAAPLEQREQHLARAEMSSISNSDPS
jgi:hypothetical protein